MGDWITWVIQGAIGAVMAIITFYWKKDQATLDQRISKVEERLDKHDNKLEELPYVFVTREDFIRAMNGVNSAQKETNAKLDKIYDILIKQSKE